MESPIWLVSHQQWAVTLKRLCLVLLSLPLLLPVGQAWLHWFVEKPLDGAYEQAARPELSPNGLLDNTYQPALERYVEEQVGFRPYLIRLRNQVVFGLFQESRARNFAVGRYPVLFEQVYIDAYLGHDYRGEEEIRFNAQRLRSVQDSLARHGVRLVFAIAPSKATFMPENLPAAVRRQGRSRTNYAAYAAALPAAGVHVLDFSAAFRRWKRTAPYPLFAPGGTHWSMYGGARAADSLAQYLRRRLQVPCAPFRLDSVELATRPRETDGDIVKALNLLWRPPSGKLAYPKLCFGVLPAGNAKPNLLLIADSFGWTWIYNHFFEGSFAAASRYWYYNAAVAWPGSERTPEGRDLSQLKRLNQYLGRDVIVVMFNEAGLAQFDRGFSRELFNLFHPYTAADHARYAALMADFRRKATWEESVREDFEQRLNLAAGAALDRERLARE